MNILLVNPHSPQNAGDLAILQEALHYLGEAYPGATITYTINDAEPADWLPKDITHLPSFVQWITHRTPDGGWRWRKWLAPGWMLWLLIASIAYRWFKIRLLPSSPRRASLMNHYYDADLIVAFGGGYLYARHSFNIAFLWIWLGMALGIIMNKPLILLPQSFGPVQGKFQRKLLCWLVERSRVAIAREQESVTFLQAIGVQKTVPLLPDLAFSTSESAAEEIEAVLAPYWGDIDPERPVIGMTLMDWGAQNPNFAHQENYEQSIMELIAHVQTVYAAQIVVFIQCFGPTKDQDDRWIARQIAQKAGSSIIVIDTPLTPNLLKAAYRRLDALVATRMHSAIFALSVETPTLVIGYLHKSKGIMKMVGLSDYILDINAVQPMKLIQQFDNLWLHRIEITDKIHECIPLIQQHLLEIIPLLRSNYKIS